MNLLTDDLGHEVEVPDEPRRIVSLVPSLSETLWWFHLAERVVGVTDYCVAPPHGFPNAERVRGTKNPHVAAIVGLEPDLVVANEEENRELDVRKLRDAGCAVYVTAPRTVPNAADSIAALGAAVGADKAGAGLAQSIERALEQASHRAVAPPLAAFVPIWRDPWMATGADTYAGDLLSRCGFEVLPGHAGGRYPEVDLDQVRGAGPEVVLLPDEPYAFADADRTVFEEWDVRTRLVDGTALTWYGPRTPNAIGDLVRLGRSLRRLERRAARRERRAAEVG